ncbi:MAG: hypothetical protein MPW15_11365 [Candidatus Manganitrophus sp.]|nr:hypothetical protein [Candidatus Manganitrophus sp.]
MKTEELERWLDQAPKGKKKMPALKGVRGRVKFEGGGEARRIFSGSKRVKWS